jgi:hypothetical protein
MKMKKKKEGLEDGARFVEKWDVLEFKVNNRDYLVIIDTFFL